MGNLNSSSSQQVSVMPALGILATAFLASMSVSSFFFIQPGDANANVGKCSSHAVVSDSIESENAVDIVITLDKTCPSNDALVYGVTSDGVAHQILEGTPVSSAEGYTVSLKLELDEELYSHYIVSIEDAFSARLESK
jgi:hypothetical protein